MFDSLVEWLPRCGADVLCLQEVTRTPGLGGWTKFSDEERQLPQRANLFDDVRLALPRHQAHFLASDAGPVVDGGGKVRQQDFGLAMFIDERIPVIGQVAGFVHGSFVDHQRWAIADRPRIAHAVRLIDRTAVRAMTVVHLHGLRDPLGKHDTPARQRRRLLTLLGRAHLIASLGQPDCCERQRGEPVTERHRTLTEMYDDAVREPVAQPIA